jgi:hypothetical protein
MNPSLDPDRDDQQRRWQAKLGRLRLGVEPIEVQLERYRRVTWVLTAIPTALAIFIFTLFTAFRRPDIGSIVALILFVPVVSIAWIDFAILKGKAIRYWRAHPEDNGAEAIPPDARSGT